MLRFAAVVTRRSVGRPERVIGTRPDPGQKREHEEELETRSQPPTPPRTSPPHSNAAEREPASGEPIAQVAEQRLGE